MDNFSTLSKFSKKLNHCLQWMLGSVFLSTLDFLTIFYPSGLLVWSNIKFNKSIIHDLRSKISISFALFFILTGIYTAFMQDQLVYTDKLVNI